METPISSNHAYFMELALNEARRAAEMGEVPIGAVVVLNDEVIATGHNLRETTQDPTAHAELLAMQEAARHVGSWRLIDCTTYVTLEPCPMCAGVMVNARLSNLVYGARDPKAGAVRSLFTLADDPRLNHRVEIIEGILDAECGQILTDFFRGIREGHVKKPGKG
ncbi:tRNA adenosine(34) deaminase TadA [Microvenator marinus]|jgi:tRNA(adenine34) deaminase|uniref:tRNA-specific adenosine deaminase n=1 Tax=Microvenator marinus TaxID=2600177 RepID=A0A5B8XMW8_9DELT|nr:tRNA adenosine(34) deaminase TadA [Microvenator marinus]QED26348.1 tRNA adenosine(34) deaminase TadA [Microvenator marinus]